MADEGSIDIIGVGKLGKAIPQKVWNQLVDTACTTFREVIAPFTSTTSGVGRLISAKFDRLVDAEKVLAADNLAKAQEKVAKSRRAPSDKPKPSIIIAAIESSGTQTDGLLRELWASLLHQPDGRRRTFQSTATNLRCSSSKGITRPCHGRPRVRL
jgi:hypothetical protein